MNYKQHDDELIRQARDRKEIDKARVQYTKKKNELENRTYSGEGLNALAKGEYNKLRTNTTNRVPELKPSTKYNNQNVVANQPQKSTRDTRFDNDFDNFFNYRYGDFSGEVDYDPVTDTDVESWRNVKKDIMRKNKWSDKEFEDKFKAYSDERYKKMGDEIIASSVETAKKHPFLGTLQQAILNPGVWLEGAANMVSGLPFVPDKYKAQSADDPMFLSSRQKEAIKQTVKDEHIKSNVGKGAYDIGTGLADMVMSAGVPVLGAATLGTETASRNQRQALERGADPNKAALTGLATGVVSGAMNKVGLDKALASNTIRGAMNKEGLENILEDVATLGIDKAINKNKSQLNAMHDYYASQGMDDQSAWTQVIKDTGLDLATSYGTGAAFGGVMSGLNRLPSLLGGRNNTPDISDNNIPAVTGDATIDNAIKQTADAEAEIQRLSEQIPKVPEVARESAPTLTPEEQAALQTELANEGFDWSDEPISANNTNTHSKDGHLLSNAKIPEYTMKEDVYFNGSDDDIALAESQDKAIVDTFRNIITDPEFNALSFKNGNKEVFVSPATNGNGLRMSYTIDGVPTGHHDYSLDQIDDLSNNLRNEVGNGGEDIKIQRKSDMKVAAESAGKNPSITSKPKDKTKPIKDQLSPEDRASIFGGAIKGKRRQGLKDSIGYAKKFAGDTAEAKKLAKEANELIESYVESGSTDDYITLLKKIEDLDNLARETRADYTTKKGDVFTYDNYFTDFDDDGTEIPSSLLDQFVGNSALSKSVKAVHDALADTTSAPTTTSMDPAHELAGRYAAAYQGFDTYDYMDNIFENDSFEESMANDIQNGRDLTGYIDALEEIIDDAPDEGTRAEMQSLIDELTTLNEGRVPTDGQLTPEEVTRLQDIADGKEDIPETGNEVPNVKPTEPTPPNNNVPNVTPPGNNPPKTSISQRYETLKKSDLFTKSEANMKMLETGKKQGVFDKDIENRRQTQEEALNDYLNNKEEVTKRNLERQWDSGKDVDTSMLILNDVLNEGDQAKVNLTLLKQAEQSKGAGRILRANRDYVGTKEGTIQKAGEYLNDKADRVLSSKKTKNQFEAMAERIVNGDLSELSSKLNMDEANIDNIRKAVKAGAGQADIVKMIGMYQAVGKTGISPEALKKISDIYDAIQDKKLNPNSKKRADLEADAFKVLADDIGGKRTWKEQWDAWRYLAMLGNPKTHLRNVLGNATHYAVTEAKDNIGAVLEGAVDKVSRKGIDRTKSILTNADKNLVDMAAKDADDVAYSALNDGKNKYNVKEEIDRARSTFNNKVLSKIDDLNSNALDVEDYTALKRKYSKSLARYLKANGADASIFGKTDENSSALLEKARAYAIDQAKQATFHEYSKMAERLNQFSKGLREGNAAEKVAGMAVEGLVPFKKTPINILKQGFKYSPVSLAKAVGKTVDAIRTGNSSASDAIEDLAAGMTGTMVMALGGFLAHQGLLTGGANENYDVDNAETEQGAQNYAIKIGNNSYTLDWLAPVSLPLFVGAELYNMSAKDNEEDEDNIDKFVTALSTIAEPVTEMSMLQGIQNMLNELSYSKENVFGTIAANTTLGYASQGIPTLAGQVARAIDPTRRSTYSDQKVGVKRQFDKALTKTKNKIPFLTQSQQPYVNASGEEQTNEGLFSSMLGDNFGTRLADQMLSPGYYKKGTVTKVDEELNRLYEATGENVYKNVSSGKVKDERLSKEDFTKYQKLYGSNNDKLYNAIVGSSDYNKLDDAERVKTITNIKNISKMIADHEIGGKELENSQQKIYDIYKTKGIDGITQYIRDKANADALGIKYDTYMKKESEQPGSAAQYAQDKQKLDAINDKYGTNIQMSTLEKYGVDGAEQRAQGSIDAKNYGFVDKDGNANVDAYTKAVDMFGNDQKSLRAYSDFHKQGLKKNAQMIPALMNNNQFTDKQKGQVIMAEHGYKYDDLGNTAKGAYDREGEAGVYYFYLLKNLADTQYGDGNGSVKKAEKVALMNSDNPNVTKLSDDMYYYLGNAKW